MSEEESEAPVMWVNNGAYCLSHSDQEIVLSRRGWLTDKIIHAAQILLLQFFPDMAGLQPPVLCLHSRSILGSLYRSYMSETTTGVLCPLLVVKLGRSMCTTACINQFQRKQSA